MTFWAGWLRAAPCVLACLSLSGCLPGGSGPLDEEKEPHFLAGKSRVSTFDYKGALECYEKALQVNPHSAAAHFEMAWLFDQKEMDPAAAIYHYEKYLTYRAKAPNAEVVKQRIMACKQALAETVSLGPVTEKIQRQFEQLAEENKRLSQETNRLHEELDKWTSYAARLQTQTSQPPPPVLTARVIQPTPTGRAPALAATPDTAVRTNAPSASTAAVRTHTVKAGETLALIARKYGVKLETLMAANSNLDARRLRIGQSLRVPGS
jgi:LysM repeat protein